MDSLPSKPTVNAQGQFTLSSFVSTKTYKIQKKTFFKNLYITYYPHLFFFFVSQASWHMCA